MLTYELVVLVLMILTLELARILTELAFEMTALALIQMIKQHALIIDIHCNMLKKMFR